MGTSDKSVRRNRATYKHGVFCLEGDWWGAKDATTVEPALELLSKVAGVSMPYAHRDVATIEEFKYYVERWTKKEFATHPILYLGFHGGDGGIWIGNGRKQQLVTIPELGDIIGEGGAKGRVVYFGSCDTLKEHGKRLDTFMRKTGVIAVCGYREGIEWVDSIAFEILALSSIQRHRLDRRGLRAAKAHLQRNHAAFVKKVGFRMRISTPPTRG